MEAKNPEIILEKVENTLRNNHVDFKKDIDGLGYITTEKTSKSTINQFNQHIPIYMLYDKLYERTLVNYNTKHKKQQKKFKQYK